MKLAGPDSKDFKLEHVDELIARLNKELENIEGRSLAGLVAAASHIFDDMDKTAPRIPIDTGNLRASFFIVSSRGGGDQSTGTGRFEGKNSGEMQSEKGQIVGIAQSQARAARYPMVAMGFTANYATYVHENLNANFAGDQSKIQRTSSGRATAATRKHTRRSGAGPRFFSSALERNAQKIIEIVSNYANIK